MHRRNVLLAPLLMLVASKVLAQNDKNYVLATATPGGTFYPVGVALAAMAKATLEQSHGIAMTAAATAGSEENVDLLRSGTAHFAILQGLVGSDAWHGRGLFADRAPDRSIRSVTGLWPNVEQFVIRSELRVTGTIGDLEGIKSQAVIFGDQGSGTLASCRALLANLGFDIERDFSLVHMSYGPAAQALQHGDVAAIALPAGLPTKSLARLKSAMGAKATVLAFTAEQASLADAGRGLWYPYRIPAGTYPSQETDIETVAQPNFLAVRQDVDEAHVYLITKSIYEYLPLLHSIHSATRSISLDDALSGLPMPLHPGAVQFFEEQGMTIPSALLAE